MSFNPDEFIKKNAAKKGFDPDRFIAENAQIAKPQDVNLETKAQAGLEAFGQSATLGYLPQIQAAVEQLIPESDTDKQLREQGFKLPEESYISARDENIRRQQKLTEIAPEASMAGSLVGAGVTMLIPGGAAAKGATTAAKIGRAALTGGAISALQNPGDVEGEIQPIQAKERFKEGVKGAALGTITAGAGEALRRASSAIRKLPKKAAEYSDKMIIKSTGAYGTKLEKQISKARFKDVAKTIGDYDLVKVGDSFDDIIERVEPLKKQAGQKLGQIYQEANDLLQNKSFVRKLNPAVRRMVNRTSTNGINVSKRLISKMSRDGRTGNKSFTGEAKKFLDEIASEGDISIERLHDIKRDVGSMVDWTREAKESPAVKQQFRILYEGVSDLIDARLNALDKAIGGNRLKSLKETNKLYSNLSDVYANADWRINREIGKNLISLGDMVKGGSLGAIGAMSGEPDERMSNGLKFLALGYLGNRALRMGGDALTAKTAKAISRVMAKPANIAKYSEKFFGLAADNPQQFQLFLQNLSNDPEFLQEVEQYERKK